MITINYLDGSPENVNALKKAAALKDRDVTNYEYEDIGLTLTEEKEVKEVQPVQVEGGGQVLVKVLNKVNDLWYNVKVYPQGIYTPPQGQYNAKLFFGDKCWGTEIPVNTYLMASNISVYSAPEEEEEENE